jgi:Helix-turn-helix domain
LFATLQVVEFRRLAEVEQTMAELESRTQTERVLTLEEAAAFLRVNEAALADKATAGEVPAQQIGGEWRFLQRALVSWLCLDEPVNGKPSADPGSKEAVLKVFGIFKDDDDMEARLADMHALREADR